MIKKLKKICYTKQNEKLKNHCTIKIGGICDFFCEPKTIRQLKNLLKFVTSKKICYHILGFGSNTVFSDNKFNGVIISLKRLNKIYKDNNLVVAYCGTSLFSLCKFCEKNHLSGIEFLYGIPGSVGGACVMNAGAFGGEIKDVLQKVLIYCNGKIKWIDAIKLNLEYRSSNIVKNNYIILKAVFKLKTDRAEKIVNLHKQFMQKRLQTQPYGTYNAGSVFKKLNNESAGKYIDKVGLKGVTIGHIQISQKHANFFINLGEGTFAELKELIEFAKQKVKNEYGVDLVEEIIFIGE